ncbi:hypothetical protein IWW36_001285 [Coemansia brasiliensis]|uniref:XPG N-terminal domain-containing protein n=1 Tax=Coemansia brasiliensis TaxID=2650707 RepID=A0A9W8M105_9FUNG|nr:hypothetical protein IWW36_001285 [Coemansia brasiliensis]
MGVRRLMSLLARFAPGSISMPKERDLAGQTMAIDSNIFIQRFFRGTDGGADQQRHLRGIYNLAKYLMSIQVTPLFVFDGRMRALGKENEMLKRKGERIRALQQLDAERERARRVSVMVDIRDHLLNGHSTAKQQMHSTAEAVEWLDSNCSRIQARKSRAGQRTIGGRLDELELEASRLLLFQLGSTAAQAEGVARFEKLQAVDALQTYNAERIETLSRRSEPLRTGMVESCERLVRALGMAALVAGDYEESEGVCAHLCRDGLVDCVCSEDLDVVAFGGRLLRGLYAGDSKTPLTLVDSVAAREELGLSRDSFVDLCILCGTDFATTIEKVGPITALRLIQEHGSIERILGLQKYSAREGFTFQSARNVFLANAPPRFASREQMLRRCSEMPDPQAVELLLPMRSQPQKQASDPFARGVVLL